MVFIYSSTAWVCQLADTDDSSQEAGVPGEVAMKLLNSITQLDSRTSLQMLLI